MTRQRLLTVALVLAVVLLPSPVFGQETMGPVGIVDTGTAGPITAVRFSSDEGSLIVTAPEALRPQGPWRLTLVVLGSRVRPTRTVVDIDGAAMTAVAEQDSVVTGETTAMGSRVVEQVSPDELSIELPEPGQNPGGILWLVTEQDGTSAIVSPIFRQNELRRALVPITDAGLGWLAPGDDQSSWYWVSVPASPTMAIDDGVLVVRPDETPLERVSGQEVNQVLERVILRNADAAGGPPLVDISLNFGEGSAAATLADGTTLNDLPWTSGSSEPDPEAEVDIRGGIDLDLEALAAESGITIDDSTMIGLTRQITLADGARVLVDGIDVPISELSGSLGAPIAIATPDDVDESEAATDEGAVAPSSADGDGGLDRTTRVGVWAVAIGGAFLLVWAIWRALRSSAFKGWRSSRRRQRQRNREVRERRAARNRAGEPSGEEDPPADTEEDPKGAQESGSP